MEINKELLERAIAEGVNGSWEGGYSPYLLLAADSNGHHEGFYFGCNTGSKWIVVCTTEEYKEALAKSKVDVQYSKTSVQQELNKLLTYLEVEISCPSETGDAGYDEGFNDAFEYVAGKIKYILEGNE